MQQPLAGYRSLPIRQSYMPGPPSGTHYTEKPCLPGPAISQSQSRARPRGDSPRGPAALLRGIKAGRNPRIANGVQRRMERVSPLVLTVFPCHGF